jgi:hypothetical protein
MFTLLDSTLTASIGALAAFTLVRSWRQVRKATADVDHWVHGAFRRYELYTEPLAFLLIVDPADQTGLSVSVIAPVVEQLAAAGVPYTVCDFREDQAMSREYGFAAVPVLICLAHGVARGQVRAEQYGKGLPLDRVAYFVKSMCAEWQEGVQSRGRVAM